MNKTLKKTLSIILTILMIVTTVPFAFAEDDGMMLYVDITNAVDTDKSMEGVWFYAFTEEDNEVIVNNELMTHVSGNIYSYEIPSNTYIAAVGISFTDESSIDWNFVVDWTGNNLYIPTGDREGTWEVYSECPHESYKDGKCEDCGIDCPHKNYKDGKCDDCKAEGTLVTIKMNDSYGDGWNGNAVKIEQLIDGAYTENATIEDGASGTFRIALPEECIYAFRWVVGYYPNECSFTIAVNGETVYKSADCSELDDGQLIYTNCEHSYTDGKCDVCGVYCLHENITDGTCDDCGFVCLHEDYINGNCNMCGYTCPHESYTDGKCDDCGIDCPHENYKDGKCNDCGVEGTLVTITMTDSYGDGWNGNAIVIEKIIDGEYTDVATATIEEGENGTFAIALPEKGIYAFRWVRGSYPDECSFTIAVNGEIVCEATDASEFEDGHKLYINCEHKNIIDCKCDVCSSYFHDWSNNDGICANGCDTICEHKAFTDSGLCKVCGYECSHVWNGNIMCNICGCYCEHPTTENGVCTECEYILPFLLTTGKNVTYHGSFVDALDEAEDGSIIKLLKNYDDYNTLEINKAITLDLNGKEWIQPSSGGFDVTANATFTDSVGGGYLSYRLYLYSPVTLSGGTYHYIGIRFETEDTIGDYLADCCDCFDRYTDELIDVTDAKDVLGAKIKADHDLGEQTCKGYKCNACGGYFGEALDHDWSNKDGVCANGCGEICIHENQTDTCEICGATVHICDFSGEWKYDNEKHWKECECTLIGEEGKHSWIFGKCTECGYACEHSFTNYTETEAPTCTEAGKEVAGCDNDCGAMNEREISALDHKDTLAQVEAQAKTCTEIGWDAYEYCTACDYSTYEEIPASHEIKTVDKKDATCTQAGHEAYEYCTECDYTTYKEIPSNGHTPLEAVKENEVAPECEKAGSYDLVVYCDVCSEELDRDTVAVDALTHKDDDGDFLCDHGCGHDFEKPVDPTPDVPDTPDEPADDTCDHICHSNNALMKFLWKIISFFYRLFNIQQYCDCGVIHYDAPIFG